MAYADKDESVHLLRLPYSIYSKYIWKPDLYIKNGVSFETEKGDSEYGVFNVLPDGTISSSQAVKMRTYCHLDLAKFPFDVQNCSVIIQRLSFD